MKLSCHHLGFPGRLHRVPGAGANGIHQDLKDEDIFDVFMTYSFDVQTHLQNKTIIPGLNMTYPAEKTPGSSSSSLGKRAASPGRARKRSFGQKEKTKRPRPSSCPSTTLTHRLRWARRRQRALLRQRSRPQRRARKYRSAYSSSPSPAPQPIPTAKACSP
jgi:hypothetical protein